MEENIGKIINGYLVERKIGEGAYSVIYKAYDAKNERKVAIKVSNVGKGSKDSDIAFNEVNMYKKLSNLNPVNIIAYYDHFIFDNSGLCIVMEYGKLPLDFLIEKDTEEPNAHRIEVGDKIEISYQLSLAVDFLQKQNIIHRDIKPNNVIICEPEGCVKLCDFGFSLIYDEQTPPKENIGSPDYVAPEIIKCVRCPKPYGPPVDLWALGVTVYELFVGKPLFYNENLKETAFNILLYNDTIIYPQGKVPPIQVCRFLKDLIWYNPDNRKINPETLKNEQ